MYLLSLFDFCTLSEGEDAPGRARDVFKKLPGERGFFFPEYGPVASHGDHIHDRFYEFVYCILCIVYHVLSIMYYVLCICIYIYDVNVYSV